MRFAAAVPFLPLLVLLVPGCTTIDEHHKVAGWPQLQVVEHYVPDDAMRSRCAKYVAFGMLPEACSEFDFNRGVCDVWYSKDYPPAGYVVRHERLHCQGYDHPGDTTLEDILSRYNQQQRASAKPAAPGT